MISQFGFDGRFFAFLRGEKCYLLGRGRRSATIGVDAGVFFVAFEAAVEAVAGAALPERSCRFGDPSTFDDAGPTDCDRSAFGANKKKII